MSENSSSEGRNLKKNFHYYYAKEIFIFHHLFPICLKTQNKLRPSLSWSLVISNLVFPHV